MILLDALRYGSVRDGVERFEEFFGHFVGGKFLGSINFRLYVREFSGKLLNSLLMCLFAITSEYFFELD